LVKNVLACIVVVSFIFSLPKEGAIDGIIIKVKSTYSKLNRPNLFNLAF
jgi:hypothetical protein